MCHMLEKYEYKILYSLQNKHNCEGARALQLPFIHTGESGEINSQQREADCISKWK